MRRFAGVTCRSFARPSLTCSPSLLSRSFWFQASKKDSFPSPPPPSANAGARAQQAKARVFGVNESNFDKEVIQSAVPCVLLVASEQAAQSVATMISNAANQYPDLKFCFLNSSLDMALAQELGVTKVPTIMAVFQGKLLEVGKGQMWNEKKKKKKK
jgi:hypothetical protein